MPREDGVIIQGLDLIDVIRLIFKKNKKFQRLTLNEIESILDPNSQEFALVRKIVLDYLNDYTRSIIRDLFGDVEGIAGGGTTRLPTEHTK